MGNILTSDTSYLTEANSPKLPGDESRAVSVNNTNRRSRKWSYPHKLSSRNYRSNRRAIMAVSVHTASKSPNSPESIDPPKAGNNSSLRSYRRYVRAPLVAENSGPAPGKSLSRSQPAAPPNTSRIRKAIATRKVMDNWKTVMSIDPKAARTARRSDPNNICLSPYTRAPTINNWDPSAKERKDHTIVAEASAMSTASADGNSSTIEYRPGMGRRDPKASVRSSNSTE